MDRVGFQVVNSAKGLHLGHESVINFGKQFGKVTATPIENLLGRNRYLETGSGTSKYRINLGKLNADCEKLDIKIDKPTYIQVTEEKRISLYNQASSFVNIYRDFLLTERYIRQARCSLMAGKLTDPKGYNLIVSGPEVLNFFYKRIANLFDVPERKIYPSIVKDEYGLKRSSSSEAIPFDIKRLRRVIGGARDRYKIGDNEKLVKELNYSYPKTVGWRINDILVYEGGFVDGRIEVTSFSYLGPSGLCLLEEVDYYA